MMTQHHSWSAVFIDFVPKYWCPAVPQQPIGHLTVDWLLLQSEIVVFFIWVIGWVLLRRLSSRSFAARLKRRLWTCTETLMSHDRNAIPSE